MRSEDAKGKRVKLTQGICASREESLNQPQTYRRSHSLPVTWSVLNQRLYFATASEVMDYLRDLIGQGLHAGQAPPRMTKSVANSPPSFNSVNIFTTKSKESDDWRNPSRLLCCPRYWNISEGANHVGIPSTADHEAIREAYKRAAFANHPDRAVNDDDRRERTARFQLINEAHYVLSDERRVLLFSPSYCVPWTNVSLASWVRWSPS